MEQHYDVVVIGSGAGGAPIAKELAESLGEPLNLSLEWIPTNEQIVVVGGEASNEDPAGRSPPREPARR